MRRIAVHIALNEFDQNAYGSRGTLYGCHNDAKALAAIAKAQGYTSSTLLDQEATAERVIDALGTAAKTLEPGDQLLVTYSGHGSQVEDVNADEKEAGSNDKLDETWCLYNRQLVDDELYRIWSLFKPGVNILLLSDSCHSGTVVRDTERRVRELDKPSRIKAANAQGPAVRSAQWIAGNTARAALGATIVQISACQDNEVAEDLDDHGLFTKTLLNVWGSGSFVGSHRDFWKAIVERMPKRTGENGLPTAVPTQLPNYVTLGAKNDAFESARPFGSSSNVGTTAHGVGPQITGPASASPEIPPTLTVKLGSHRYYEVELATAAQLFDEQAHRRERNDDNFFATWTDGETRLTDAQYAIPEVVWNRFKQAKRVYYRVISTPNADSWEGLLGSVIDDNANSAPFITLLKQSPPSELKNRRTRDEEPEENNGSNTETVPEKTEGQPEPENTQPEPENTQPEPEKTEPENTQPEPEKTEPENTQPEPEKTEPENTQPEPEKTEPENTQPEPEKTDPEKTDPEKTETENTQPDPKTSEKPEPEKLEPEKPEKPKPEKAEADRLAEITTDANDNRLSATDSNSGTASRIILRGEEAWKSACKLLAASQGPIEVDAPPFGKVTLTPGTSYEKKLLAHAYAGVVYYLDGTDLWEGTTANFTRDIWLSGLSRGVASAAWLIPIAKAEASFLMAFFIPWWGMLLFTGAQAFAFYAAHKREIHLAYDAAKRLHTLWRQFEQRYPKLAKAIMKWGFWQTLTTAPNGVEPEDVAYFIGRVVGKQGLIGKVEQGIELTLKVVVKIVVEYAVLVGLLHAPSIVGRALEEKAKKYAKDLQARLEKQGFSVAIEEATAILKEIGASANADREMNDLKVSAENAAETIRQLIKAYKEQTI